MPRDGSPARARLRAAALALYRERGFDQTTSAQIAARAGVTERTFFRHFPDKREVLFDGEQDLRATLVDAVASAPTDRSPLQLVVQAAKALVPVIEVNRAEAAERAKVIAVTPALQERAYAKTEMLVDALTEALVVRGHERVQARLTAQVGMAVFQYATSRWTEDFALDLNDLIVEAANKVRSLGAE